MEQLLSMRFCPTELSTGGLDSIIEAQVGMSFFTGYLAGHLSALNNNG
jgi:hypothetical protein